MKLLNIQNTKNYFFYKLPKKIIDETPYKDNISNNSKLAYMLLLNRLSISRMNNYFDGNGNIYIYYSREEMQYNLNISKSTSITIFKELTNLKLIYQVKEKLHYKIYLYDIFENNYKSKEENTNLKGMNFTPNKVKNSYPNNKEYIKNKNTNSYKNYDQRVYPEGFFDQFYDNL